MPFVSFRIRWVEPQRVMLPHSSASPCSGRDLLHRRLVLLPPPLPLLLLPFLFIVFYLIVLCQGLVQNFSSGNESHLHVNENLLSFIYMKGCEPRFSLKKSYRPTRKLHIPFPSPELRSFWLASRIESSGRAKMTRKRNSCPLL